MSRKSFVVCTVLGTRPEIVKLAPLVPHLDAETHIRHVLLHTGQHYSTELDAVFFDQLGLRPPDVHLSVGSQSHAAQTGAILVGAEQCFLDHEVRLVLALGDTNSTLGAALAAAKLAIPVVHIEAGCRSFVKTMPEEINRVVVDHLATQLLAPDEQAKAHLLAEGISEKDITVVGSTAIDAARHFAKKTLGRTIVRDALTHLGLSATTPFLLCTVHRAENTTASVLPGLLRGLGKLAARHPIVWPVHPRTRHFLAEYDLPTPHNVLLLPPLGYLDLLALLKSAQAVCTDSGGLQEEAYALGTPVLILRDETEWTYLVEHGCAALIGKCEEDIETRGLACLTQECKQTMRTAAQKLSAQLHDGSASLSILQSIKQRWFPSALAQNGFPPTCRNADQAGAGVGATSNVGAKS